MAIVGYLEGTEPLVLTRLNLRGIGTTPLGNGFDGHGKYIGHITRQDGIRVVVGYLHKVLPTGINNVTAADFLNGCHVNNIPVLLVAPPEDHETARKLLGEAAEWAALVTPGSLFDETVNLCN